MDKQISTLIAENKFERREFDAPHNLYADEHKLLSAVSAGDVKLVKKLSKEPKTGTPGRLSPDPLRNQKNLLIVSITIISRAAIDGGLSNEEAFTLSDAYILRSEYCNTVSEVIQIGNEALVEFTERVADVHMHSYSPIVEKAIDYISLHLHSSLTLEDTSKALNISPSYLSRLFRKETGVTYITFIQKERIHAAANMLRFSQYSYIEIATYLGFKSQSYFGNVFKKYIGKTPMEYRRTLK